MFGAMAQSTRRQLGRQGRGNSNLGDELPELLVIGKGMPKLIAARKNGSMVQLKLAAFGVFIGNTIARAVLFVGEEHVKRLPEFAREIIFQLGVRSASPIGGPLLRFGAIAEAHQTNDRIRLADPGRKHLAHLTVIGGKLVLNDHQDTLALQLPLHRKAK